MRLRWVRQWIRDRRPRLSHGQGRGPQSLESLSHKKEENLGLLEGFEGRAWSRGRESQPSGR